MGGGGENSSEPLQTCMYRVICTTMCARSVAMCLAHCQWGCRVRRCAQLGSRCPKKVIVLTRCNGLEDHLLVKFPGKTVDVGRIMTRCIKINMC